MMNYRLAYKAEMIANKLKKESSSPMPRMMFHGEAYAVIMAGREADYLSVEEIKSCETITEERAQQFID